MASESHSKTLGLCLALPLSFKYKSDGIEVAPAFLPTSCSAALIEVSIPDTVKKNLQPLLGIC